MSGAILHVLRSLNPADGGPVELVRRLCAEHAATGVATEVTTLDAPGAPWLGGWPVPVEALDGHRKYGWTPELVHRLRKRAAQFSGVVIHGLWQWQGVGVRQALQGTATPYFLFPHGMLDPWFRVSQPLRHLRKIAYWRLAEHRVIRDAAAILFTCEEERRLGRTTFQPWEARREEIIPLGTHSPPADAAALRADFFARFPGLEGKRLLLFLGRLHEKKGCDLLLEAFRRTKPPMHLVFAGPGADTPFGARLKTLAKGLSVDFLGPLYERDKWAALAAAEAFILPSHQENFGIAVAEALASGLPVLLSNKVNTWSEIAAAAAGLVEPDDANGTIRLIERWLASDQTAMRTAARQCFAERFDIRRTAANLVALLQTAKA